MSKIIIYIDGRPLVQGFVQREFRWSDAHGCYLYESREYELAEFNAVYAECIRRNSDLAVRVRVLVSEPVVSVTVCAAPAVPVPPPISVTREITVEEAEAVMLKFAPHRVRAKTGPKPKAVEV